MNIANKDLNLLTVFAAIWEERNLSKAAVKLFLSQPAVSHALNRLREQFDDPLFLRSSKGVTPTDFAISISEDILKLVQQAESLYHKGRQFKPAEVNQVLRLATGDYFASTIAQRLISQLTQEAPNVQIVCLPDAEVFASENFEQGKIQLGITGFLINPKEGLLQKKIISDSYVCCFRKGHPLGDSSPGLKPYLNSQHLLVSVIGRPFGRIDEELKNQKKSRNIQVVVPTFFEAGLLLEKTDLVLTGPKGLCEYLAKAHNLQVAKLPFKTEPFSLYMHWHQRTEVDPFHQWVREKTVEVASAY